MLLLLIAAISAGCQKSASDGKLSDSEMKEASADVLGLAQGAKAGDPTSANFAYEPKTQFGKDFKVLFVKSAGIEKTMAGILNSINLEKILSADRLSTPKGIEASKADLKKLEDASTKYYDDTGKVAVEMIDLISKAMGSTPDSGSLVLTETRQIAAKSAGLWAAAEKVLSIAEKGHATKASGNFLRFPKDADATAYTKAFEELQKVATDHDEFIAKTMAARQERLASGMNKLNSMK